MDDDGCGGIARQICAPAASGGEAAAAIAVTAGGVERCLCCHAGEGIGGAARGRWHTAERIGRALSHASEQHTRRGLVDFDRDDVAGVAAVERAVRHGLGARTQGRAFAAQGLVGGAGKGAGEIVGAGEVNGHIAVVPAIGVCWSRGCGTNRGLGQVNPDGADRDRGGHIVGKIGARAGVGGRKVRALGAEGLIAADGIGGQPGEGALLLADKADRHRAVVPAKPVGSGAHRGPNQRLCTVDLYGETGLRQVARFVRAEGRKRLGAYANIACAAGFTGAVDNAAEIVGPVPVHRDICVVPACGIGRRRKGGVGHWPVVVGRGIDDGDLAIATADAALEGDARWAEAAAAAAAAFKATATAAIQTATAAAGAAAATIREAARATLAQLAGGAGG